MTDGRFVAFRSDATNLDPRDTDNDADLAVAAEAAAGEGSILGAVADKKALGDDGERRRTVE